MSNWTRCDSPFVWQRRFGVKIGHVLQRSNGDWTALFDGYVLGTHETLVEARVQVESAGGVC